MYKVKRIGLTRDFIHRVCTHRYSFDEDIIHSVLIACKVGHRDLFVPSDASPCRNSPFHLLDFGFLVLVAILQPVAKRSKTSSVTWLVSSRSDISL